jgi:hypothetical protein
MKVQIKTGSEWHSTETRSAMIKVNGEPIYKVLKALNQKWVEVGRKGTHGKWCIAEYVLPVGAVVTFEANANGRVKISETFTVGDIETVDLEGYQYQSEPCGWIVEID